MAYWEEDTVVELVKIHINKPTKLTELSLYPHLSALADGLMAKHRDSDEDLKLELIYLAYKILPKWVKGKGKLYSLLSYSLNRRLIRGRKDRTAKENKQMIVVRDLIGITRLTGLYHFDEVDL